jgi:hypothetical protein
VVVPSRYLRLEGPDLNMKGFGIELQSWVGLAYIYLSLEAHLWTAVRVQRYHGVDCGKEDFKYLHKGDGDGADESFPFIGRVKY